jgi:bromodomain and WD repeat domain containing protein 1/3
MFLAAGSADHHVRVYIMSEEGPKRILEIESHTDTVDSIQWAHSGELFYNVSIVISMIFEYFRIEVC